MVLSKCLIEATEWIHANWDKIPHGPDPTPSDIIYLATAIQQYCSLSPGKFNLSSAEADGILREVGTYLLGETRVGARGSNPILRERTLQTLRDELGSLESMLKALPTVVAKMGTSEEALMKALYLYGSFLAIAKSCRSSDSGNPTANEASLALYRALVEKGKENSWIMAGIILVRILRPNEPMVEDWIPKDSPYWENL
jgi:hypothetical protein